MMSGDWSAVPDEMDPREVLDDYLMELGVASTAPGDREGAAPSMREGGGDGDVVPNLDKLAGRREEITSLFRRVIGGQLAHGRRPKYGPEHLDERHLMVVMLRAAGMDQGTIARTTGFTEPWVSIILNHPDAEYVLAHIVGYAADNVLDLHKRIQATAPEAFEKVVSVMRTTPDEALASKNAFQILNMAGYGAVEKKFVRHDFGLSDEGAKELADAMREAASVQTLSFAEFVETGDVKLLASQSGAGPGESSASPEVVEADEKVA